MMTSKLPDGTYINQFTQQVPQEVFLRQVLLALANWVSTAGLSLDSHVPFQAMPGNNANHKLEQFLQKIEESSGQRTVSSRELSEFIYHMVLQLLNTSEFACVASALAGTLSDAYASDVTIAGLASYPALMLAQLVNILEEMRAKVLRIALELAPYGQLRSSLVVQFCRYFTLTHSHADYRLQEHEAIDEDFHNSQFGIVLIDSYGSLLKMLQHIDHLYCSYEQLIVAVDFEGVELNRHGPLCLVQMTIHDNPALVYVLDIHVLKRACNPFELASPGGISMKFILEDNAKILKLWFDPRNDVDALYHQFGVASQNIYDLQLADVALRRLNGDHAQRVLSLQNCLLNCEGLDDTQKGFAETIKQWGKRLFEPKEGGSYKVFQDRPLRDEILIYAAHDSRYMRVLYDCYRSKLDLCNPAWSMWVAQHSTERSLWYTTLSLDWGPHPVPMDLTGQKNGCNMMGEGMFLNSPEYDEKDSKYILKECRSTCKIALKYMSNMVKYR